jgi:LmbE family N-acetylglucosaminyl deacetylase
MNNTSSLKKHILLSLAHPDDESFGSGALIAKYIAEGVGVSLICATNGDVGTVAPERLQGYESVAALRLDELACAAQVLGLSEVITFGYRDSGMMGSPDNAHAHSLWSAPLEEVAARIAEVIRRLRPQVVITFDAFGGYGHPDHIKMHQATLAAFQMLQGDPARPPKLYYGTLPRSMIRFGVIMMRLMGRDPRKVGENRDLDLVAILDQTPKPTTWIDVSRYFDKGVQAAACHASQVSPRQSMGGASGLRRAFFRYISRHTTLIRAEPPPTAGEARETDVLAGVG